MHAPLSVLYEDNHLLVINKPAGLVTMGSQDGEVTAATLAADYLRDKYNKPGNVFVGVVSRLDRMVSGVLVLARTSKAASRLSEQIRAQSTIKRYLAWVEGQYRSHDWTELVDWVSKDESAHRMRVVQSSQPRSSAGGAVPIVEARMKVRTLEISAWGSLLEIELLTGRKHQIRLQLSQRGHPVLGDQKYDASSRFPKGIALHSRALTIQHPTRDEQLTFEAPLPSYWP